MAKRKTKSTDVETLLQRLWAISEAANIQGTYQGWPAEDLEACALARIAYELGTISLLLQKLVDPTTPRNNTGRSRLVRQAATAAGRARAAGTESRG